MSVFDRTKNVQRRRDHSWLNGIDAVSTEQPDYERNLLLTDDEIDTKTEHYMQSYQKALKGSRKNLFDYLGYEHTDGSSNDTNIALGLT